MASSPILHQNEFGFSWKCACYEAVHIHFGNVSMMLNYAQLKSFATYISEGVSAECHIEDRDRRCLHIPTHDHCVMITVSYHELESLSEILDNTLLMLQVEHALDLNGGSDPKP